MSDQKKVLDSFKVKDSLKVGGKEYDFYSLKKLKATGATKDFSRLPRCLRVMLENLVRNEDGLAVQKEDIEALAAWDPKAEPSKEIQFNPARVILQDFTGVPAVVDLAAMRDALKKLGGDPKRINPLQQVDLVIDHSVQVDSFGSGDSLLANSKKDYERNKERYQFLRWGQKAFENFRVVPPETGIVHQVNLEYLAQGVYSKKTEKGLLAYPDTLVGTDSHTTMINGLGVVGWGVGGIEAEAAMLGQPITLLVPQVVGFRLEGELPTGATATDLVLVVTEMLRKKGVVGKFVEFFGSGLKNLSLADRATISNMAPEYGATIGYFPMDEEVVKYLKFTNRPDEAALVKAYCNEQDLFVNEDSEEPVYTDTLTLDLSTVVPSLAGPKRPQDRFPLSESKKTFEGHLKDLSGDPKIVDNPRTQKVEMGGESFELKDGSVVIAAITSCTNTSNPSVMIAAGLMAKKARERGLQVKPWVKTSLAPGSKVVTEYLKQSGLLEDLDALKFNVVAYGCTTCIGNSGPLPDEIADGISKSDVVACSVLSGNRNFEGRINPHVKANYLASPPLVVAYALAGNMHFDWENDSLGEDPNGNPVYMKDLWPSQDEVRKTIHSALKPEMFSEQYSNVFEGNAAWKDLPLKEGDLYDWDEASTYVKNPPFFEGLKKEVPAVNDIEEARCLVKLGDTVTTDHISPAGAIAPDSPAGKYLQENGVKPRDFNSYGSRRGNHEVMMRGTFANIRLKNQLAPGTEGSWTTYFPNNEKTSIYDAAMKYRENKTPLIILAGKEYGTGSSRDWAAKGTALLGARAVIAESFERIHRSNLIGMGVLPLQFEQGEGHESLGLDGSEKFTITGLTGEIKPAQELQVKAVKDNGEEITFKVLSRIDTPNEAHYYKNGGILQYVLRQMA